MAEKMTLDQAMYAVADKCANDETAWAAWLQVHAHLAQPAQAVDVVAIKTLLELVEGDHGGGHTEADCRYCVAVNTITRAIGNACTTK